MKRLKTDLYLRFSMGTAAVVMLVILMVFGYMSRQQRATLGLRLSEKATFINSFYSFLIADALSRNDDVTLQQVIESLEKDQEVTSVVVIDQKGEVRYHADPQKVGEIWNDELLSNSLQKGEGVVTSFQNAGGEALALVSPLKVKGQTRPIGAVRVELTFKHVDKQLRSALTGFPLIILGALSGCVGLMLYWVKKWVFYPMQFLQHGLMTMKPSMLEPNFPETDDEFGRINHALNDLIIRIKTDAQNQQVEGLNQSARERVLFEQLSLALRPDGLIWLADKDNRILADLGQTNGSPSHVGMHLLDLIVDANFATLVGNAFQSEGQVARAPVTYQDQSYEATVLRLPVDLSKTVRTVIALQDTPK